MVMKKSKPCRPAPDGLLFRRHLVNESTMTKICLVVREVGRLKPEYSLEFDVPEIPQLGSYISIQRPDEPEPYGEDMIVEQVWWRLRHPETGGFGSNPPKVGTVSEIFVECSPAVGPYSSGRWRDLHEAARQRGDVAARQRGDVEEIEVARLSIRQDTLKKP